MDLKGPTGEVLTVDLARLGRGDAHRVVLVTSGLHGIEGFVGSAIQAAVLEEGLGAWWPDAGGAVIFVHGLNPWGMAYGRRVNEDNVDLNRNFLGVDEPWRGLPDGFIEVDRLLHPHGGPRRVSLFALRALILRLRRGEAALHAPAAGQFDRPRALFFGGNGPSRTNLLVRAHLPRVLSEASEILHLDLHAGLGPRGRVVLLCGHPQGSEDHDRLVRAFGEGVVLPQGEPSGVRGAFLPWLGEKLRGARYEGITAEFGSVRPTALLAALREENRAWHHDQPGTTSFIRAQDALAEALVPRSRRWRDRVVPLGVRLVQRALQEGLGAPASGSERATRAVG